jgi:dienelactone hydrolase
MTRSTLAAALTAVVALGLAGFGAAGLIRADDGLVRSAAVVDGLPTVTVREAGSSAGGRAPGVVVAHGFAASGTLMAGFADTLARNGFVVELFDFSGHGTNTRPLDTDTLGADLDVAVRHLRSNPGVDPTRIALVGHSMGAGAVVAYAADHPDIVATVALSLPDAGDVPSGAARPRDLLLLYGQAEFQQFPDAALTALHKSDPNATLGQTIGDPATGPARRAVAVPGVEHISILYADTAHRETLSWLSTALGTGSGGGPIDPRRRLVPASLLLLGLVLGFYPLARLVLPRRRPVPAPPAVPVPTAVPVPVAVPAGPAEPASMAQPAVPELEPGGQTGWPRTEWGVVELGLFAAAVLAVVVGLLAPDNLFGLAVGGYSAAVFGAVGVGTLVVAAALHGPRYAPGRAVRYGVGGAILTAYGAATIAVPGNAGLTTLLPVGPRWWLLPLVALACFALFLGAETLGRRRGIVHAIVLAIAVVALTGFALAGVGPGFIVLVVPLLAVLFVVEAGWAAVIRALRAPAWIAAAAGALLVAWPVALTNPLV